MGGFSDLERRARDAERRVIDGQESVLAHARAFGQTFRWRYLAGTIIIGGLATGIAAHQFIRMGAVAAARSKLRPRSTPKPSKGLRRRALSLIPIAQVVYTQLKKRLASPPPGPTPQSTRSISRADHSSARAGNGLLRH
ncbi:MAG: hypothetical protein LC632_01205 [Xanthomonadaceae bacterium]|nr:hypothetical protein [Xanthomonadaceae bacterium]